MKREFESALIYGEAGEIRADQILSSCGIVYRTITPRHDGLILPDRIWIRDKEPPIFVEIKRKKMAFMFRAACQLQTGISQSQLAHYRRVEQSTGLPVWIMMLHDHDPETIKFAPLSWYIARKHVVGINPYDGVIMWAYDQIPQWVQPIPSP